MSGLGRPMWVKRTSPSCLGELMLKRRPAMGEDLFADALDLAAEALRELVERAEVDAHAGFLHAVEHGDEREIDGLVNAR